MVLGFIYVGTMPLYAAIARKNLPLRMMGTVIGPLARGLIYDSFGSHMWLYVSAWGIGIGAFLIALTFRPLAKEQVVAAA